MDQPADNYRKVDDKVIECFLIAQNYFKRNFELPQVVFDLIGRCAGQAVYSPYKIRINPILLNQNPETIINQTVPHEVAHLISVLIHGLVGGRGHGNCWKQIMRNVFHLSPDRCHQLDTSQSLGKTVKRHIYFCPVCKIELSVSTTRHNQIRNFENIRHLRCNRTILISDHQFTRVLDRAVNLV